VLSRFRSFRPLSAAEPVPVSSQQAGYTDKLNRAHGRLGMTMSGGAHAAAMDLPGALGRDGVPGGEALAGPGAGDYVLVQHERYTKIVFIFLLEHSISPSCFFVLVFFLFLRYFCCVFSFL
jgi:hypothetical protein